MGVTAEVILNRAREHCGVCALQIKLALNLNPAL
jgi:hypothetical protein